ncbi:MAG: DUF4198 domain-containing protein [Vicinamibacterales bacterium]
MTPSLHQRVRRTSLLAVTFLLVSAAAVLAHDFWLVPDAFSIAPGGELVVRGQTSSDFPKSESAVALDRIASAALIGATGSEPIRGLSHAGTSLLIRQPMSREPGQRVVAVALHPRTVRESPESFRRYLVLEGAPEALARYERDGLLPTDSITRRYAKYAKTLVEVGAGGPAAFDRPASHPAEFIPLADPRALAPGDTLPVRLVFRGQPVRGARLHAGTAPTGDGAKDFDLTTDAHGVARVPIARRGLWNVRAIHIVPADAASGADWDVHWTTLVFGIEPQRGR